MGRQQQHQLTPLAGMRNLPQPWAGSPCTAYKGTRRPQEVTTARTNCAFSGGECCHLPTLAMMRSGDSSFKTLSMVCIHEDELGQELHGLQTRDTLGSWVGRSATHGYMLTHEPTSLTSSALADLLRPGPRWTHRDSHIHTVPECPRLCWTPTITSPTLLHSADSTDMPLLQGMEMLSTPLSTWQATSSSTLLSHQGG